MLTISSQKIYGPKGAAALFIKNGVKIEPLLHGGGQEKGLRSSTENVPAIVGFAKAAEIAISTMEKEKERLTRLRDKIIETLTKEIPNCYLNGHPVKRIYNNINVRFSFVEGEAILFMLNSHGIAVSTASACSSPKLEPSHVLSAMGLKQEEAHGSIRISLGRWTKESEVNYLLKVLPEVVKKLREISPYK
ncbi:MAG: cysteine desulfurase NifS [Parcubacteria bacterium 34_609]|nr:MAG: cysteine desulfurase NifS [Parcubacteria bacterium 34_609]